MLHLNSYKISQNHGPHKEHASFADIRELSLGLKHSCWSAHMQPFNQGEVKPAATKLCKDHCSQPNP